MTVTATKLEEARATLARAEAAFERAQGRVGLPSDPGALSGIRRTTTGRQARKEMAAVERASDLYFKMYKAQKELQALEHRLGVETRGATQNATATVDLDALAPGDLIRYERLGRSLNNWARVVRVNAKTVTCEAPAPGFDQPKIRRDKIVETRKATP